MLRLVQKKKVMHRQAPANQLQCCQSNESRVFYFPMTEPTFVEAHRAGAGAFPTTHWSVVLAAGDQHSPQAEQALTALCRAYWYPLYAYVRRAGQSPADAQDAVQGFFAHLLQGQRLARVQPARGRFRSFLLAALRNFLADERRRQGTQKRGAHVVLIPLETDTAEERYRLEPVDRRDPEKLFERRWAITVLERVLERLKAEAPDGRAKERLAHLQPFLLADDASPSYAEVGRRLGISEGAVKMAVLRLRQRSRELFRAEIANTVAAEEDIEDEVRHMFAVLAD
jgi:RNA polymerase sigma-70 factor (ECF subfamily)